MRTSPSFRDEQLRFAEMRNMFTVRRFAEQMVSTEYIRCGFFVNLAGKQACVVPEHFSIGKMQKAQRPDAPAVACALATQSSASCAFTHTVRPGSLMRVVCV